MARRLLYLSGYALDSESGASEHVWEVASGLARAGWDVTLIAPAGTAGADEHRNLEVVAVRGGRVLLPLALARELFARLRHRDFDIAYVRPARKTVLAVEVLKRSKIRYVVEVNTSTRDEYEALGAPRLQSALANRIERSHFSGASGAACMTSELVEYAREMLPVGAPAWITGNGFNRERVRFVPFDEAVRRKFRVSSDAFILVFVGNLNVWHGVDLALSALEHLPTTWLWVIGDGPAKTRLQDFARRAGVADRVCWHGWQSGEELQALLGGADVGVGTLALGRNNMREAQPLKVRLYLGSGLPVIIGYQDTLLNENPPGVSFASDTDELVRVVRELQGTACVRDDGFRRQIRSFALERLSWDVIVKETSGKLSELAESSKGTHGSLPAAPG